MDANKHRRFFSENIALKPKGLQRCCRCAEILSVDKFSVRHSSKGAHKAGEVLSYCKICSAKTRGEKQGPESHWAYKYGLMPEEARAMKQDQNFKCAICQKDMADTRGGYKGWYVDHDHTTGKVRALTCQHCNTMLGFAKDCPEILEAGAKYLRENAR